MDREYVIVCNEHKGLFDGCILFWGNYTSDACKKRSFGGYTSEFNKCEKYTKQELLNSGYNFPFYNGENEIEFRKIPDVFIKVTDLFKLGWLEYATIFYRP